MNDSGVAVNNNVVQLITDSSNNVYAASKNGYVNMYNGESWNSMGKSSLHYLLGEHQLYTVAVS